jgi:SAM-dependent methyltransferase
MPEKILHPKDYFSGHAADYANFRPHYPTELIKYISKLIKYRGVAWDCACGNGQLAVALANHFHLVMATDISENQISKAPANKGIFYTVQSAEKTDFPDAYFDLITIGQALHWFNLPAFYKEAKRVLTPNGLIVAIAYGFVKINPELDAIINRLYSDTLGDYWPPERQLIEDKYASIFWPFTPLDFPAFEMKCNWSLTQMMGYLNTWSAVKAYEKANHLNPVQDISEELNHAWGQAKNAEITFPLIIKAGKNC